LVLSAVLLEPHTLDECKRVHLCFSKRSIHTRIAQKYAELARGAYLGFVFGASGTSYAE